MDPTILDGALVIWRDNVKYENLAVGDIIFFRERKDADIISSGVQRSNLIKEGETLQSRPEPTAKPQQEQSEQSKQNIEYRPNQSVIHRIVEIEKGELTTKGDNNLKADQLPVEKSGYIGVVAFHMNYVGWPFRLMHK